MNAAEARATAMDRVHSLTAEERSVASGRIIKRVISWDAYKSSKSIFIFIGTDWEIDTVDLIKNALAAGKMVFAPRCIKRGHMIAVHLDSLDNMRAGAYGIPEPTGSRIAKADELQLMIIPGIAFDKNGWRVGRGAGYYDRFMAENPGHAAALAYDCQIIDDIQPMPHDVPVKTIITESGIYNFDWSASCLQRTGQKSNTLWMNLQEGAHA